MPKKTINEAIIEALKREGKPHRIREIYSRILEDDLYRFNATNPEHIVRTQLRRHSENLNFPTSHKTKHFILLNDGKYWLKGISTPETRIIEKKEIQKEKESSAYEELKSLHKKYISQFRQVVLSHLISLDPFSFEQYCKELLGAYGFRNVKVTSKSKDGGIDGYGELKIGLASLKVAFECKKWAKTTVGRPKISQFRGDIQGKFQQGIYFTTSKFTKEAKAISFQAGAVPIILVDGIAIIDIMIEKGFGIEKEMLPIYTNAIDLVLQNNA